MIWMACPTMLPSGSVVFAVRVRRVSSGAPSIVSGAPRLSHRRPYHYLSAEEAAAATAPRRLFDVRSAELIWLTTIRVAKMTCSAAAGRIQRERGMSLIVPPAKLAMVTATTVDPHAAKVAARSHPMGSCRRVNHVHSAVSARKSACRPKRVSVPVARETLPSSQSVASARNGTERPRRFSSAGRFARNNVRVLAIPSGSRLSNMPKWLTVNSQLVTTQVRRRGSASTASPACSAVDSSRARRWFRACRTERLVARARNRDHAAGVYPSARRTRISSSVAARLSGSSSTPSGTEPLMVFMPFECVR
jgi:hypothetical protein